MNNCYICKHNNTGWCVAGQNDPVRAEIVRSELESIGQLADNKDNRIFKIRCQKSAICPLIEAIKITAEEKERTIEMKEEISIERERDQHYKNAKEIFTYSKAVYDAAIELELSDDLAEMLTRDYTDKLLLPFYGKFRL